MNRLEKALMVAENAHKNQSYGLFPYIFHIKEVVNEAINLGCDEITLISCALHDVIEDSELSFNDIKKHFGEEVAEVVYCVTDELGRNRKEKKLKTYPKIKNNWRATLVKICDRISNIKKCKIYDHKKLEMYTKESEEFYNQIFNENHIEENQQELLNKAWKNLDFLMLEVKNNIN